ncbi:MAG: hypothetical protein JSV04_08840 [Candidatus Heimdallarchaeota archaeon]|nr:MAG: hypothetical protein JSV04_08840 [Candidatus Heimdallarchaeota archaeon]
MPKKTEEITDEQIEEFDIILKKNKLEEFLRGKGLPYKEVETNGEYSVVVPCEIADKVFKIILQFDENWLMLTAKIIDPVEFADKAEELQFYRRLLREIHDLPEINYSISEDGAVYSSADMDFEITDYSVFYSEFFGIEYAINNFVERIAPDFNLTVEGFAEDPDVKDLAQESE